LCGFSKVSIGYGVFMTNWFDKFGKLKTSIETGLKAAKSSLQRQEHIDWSTWMTIWGELCKKEGIPQSPWFELELGANDQGDIFEKMSFGLKSTLGKVTLEKRLNNNKQSMHLIKLGNEICSVIADNQSEFEKFWNEMRVQAYGAQCSIVEENLLKNRLGLADEKKIAHEVGLLKWFQTTNELLSRAVKQAHLVPHQFVTARVFLGRAPLQQDYTVIIHCFNIEEVLVITSKRWKVLAYDHKDSKVPATNPSMVGIIELHSKQFWENMVQLIKLIIKI
jgi:hypothetical protein